MVEMLIAKGAEVNTKSSYGELESESLIVAIEAGHTEVAKLLLDKGANPNTEGVYNRSALEVAARKENAAMVRELLNHKAEVNKERGLYGGIESPALEAAYKNENAEIIGILKGAGAVESN